jgi:cell division transport system ATP-binding protein
MIKFENVSKIYPPNTVALKNVSFEVDKGEFLLIVGRSGAGKTTLLRLLILEDRPTSGEIFYNTFPISKLSYSNIPYYRRKFGIVYQDYRLLENLTAFENVAFSMMVVGKTDEEIKKRVSEVLAIVGLENKKDQFPYQLSSGEKQRLAIARAIVNNPEVLLADEPTGNLDCYFTLDIANLLKDINKMGTTVILATHDRDFVANFQTRIITLENGKIIRDDKEGRFIL